MKIVAQTTDIVRLSFLEAMLHDAGIDYTVLDQHICVTIGGIGAFPRRLAVDNADAGRARALIADIDKQLEPAPDAEP